MEILGKNESVIILEKGERVTAASRNHIGDDQIDNVIGTAHAFIFL